VEFDEGAPTDEFTIVNASASTSITSLRFDLGLAAGDLVFDTESGGSGVEVYQPFEEVSSTASLDTLPSLLDGDSSLRLEFSTFGPGEAFRFTTDIDDRLTDSALGQIQVTGGELAGAEVVVYWNSRVTLDSGEVTVTFDDSNTIDARLPCPA